MELDAPTDGGAGSLRYDRCESNANTVLTDPSISRVHLLLVRVGEHVYGVDTGSTNGLWVDVSGNRDILNEPNRCDWERRRTVRMTDDTVLCLGNEQTLVRWQASANAW